MPHSCSSLTCTNRFTVETRARGISFHRFPKDRVLRRKWEKAVRRGGFASNSSTMLCSEHFRPEDFDRTGQTVRLREGTVPVCCFKPPDNKAPRMSQTSQKAREPLPPDTSKLVKETPTQPEPKSVPVPAVDHAYASTPEELRVKLSEALARVESLERDKRNAKDRERRARNTVSCLLEDLEVKKILNDELKERLDIYSDLPVHLLSKHSHKYTKEQREFAATLHFHGPKAYDYLRESLHINLPHPHTLQKWVSSGETKPDLNTTMLDTSRQEDDTAQYLDFSGCRAAVRENMELSRVNELPYEEFVKIFGNVVERCPIVAAAVCSQRPFADVDALEAAICDFIDALSESGKEGILRCLPELAGQDLQAQTLSHESKSEQSNVGMDTLGAEEGYTLSCLNEEYKERFGFPFVICTRLSEKASIFLEIRNRIANGCTEERERAIEEVKKICRLRLRDLVHNDAAAQF
ncbi:2-oxo-4-hydroxy-4-carboxy-5-ureidoimidazoline decarboxylase isoform X3 [Hippocampus zosterae]|uniref:2-oxo-4-hydroxy-4-carboxy-5-ureidoimidazoline decarboxylase isoform X2 n=1 Tax=Hippocampus zosterae TaxID=109293 RepID=UPI00223E83F1|nr:2-oxo-4-hydroxy-4-carboxy-5-ureidoimidazoline decarboxylase isoform X2 [Hippocampus zosterae]XP_051910491.1 2-oxo-4-hydroxy-4-carboxy-5-ureidoimidazoline decarboxylase isoform X3 [Hippocampus zosterae]